MNCRPRLAAASSHAEGPSAPHGAIGLAVGLSALATLLLALRLMPRGLAEVWVWPWRDAALPVGRPAVAACAAVLIATLLALDRVRSGAEPSRRLCAGLLVAMVVLSVIAMTAMPFADPSYWALGPAVVVSDISMGYYTEALQASSTRQLFAEHRARASDPSRPDRVRTHPPGPAVAMRCLRGALMSNPTLLAWLTDRLSVIGLTPAALQESAQVFTRAKLGQLDALVALPIALLVTLPAALVCVPVFAIGAVMGSRRNGIIAAALAMTIPSLLAFVPSIDAMPALWAALLTYLWLLALRSGSVAAYCLCGLVAAFALLWTFGLAAMAVPLTLLAAIALRRAQTPGGWLILARGAGAALTILAIAYLGIYLWSGYSLPGAMAVSLDAHRQIIQERLGRPYLASIPANFYDFALFAGPALSLLWAWRLVEAGRARHWQSPGAELGLAVAALLALLLLSGSTRGEVGRIWVFLMPLMTPAAAEFLSRLRESPLLGAGAALVLAQVAFAVSVSAQLALVRPY